jgi:FMN-dependent NADH-azoreductase
MTLFRLDASIRVDGSHSRQIADIVQREWDTAHPGETVINREIGIDPLPPSAWASSLSVAMTAAADVLP